MDALRLRESTSRQPTPKRLPGYASHGANLFRGQRKRIIGHGAGLTERYKGYNPLTPGDAQDSVLQHQPATHHI